MSWLRVDDGFPEHAKLQALERDPRLWADALALWLAAGCYSRRTGTGGFISDERLVRLTPLSARRALVCARALVEETVVADGGAGLWERVEGGYQFHDWQDYGRAEDRDEEPRRPLTDAERAKLYRERKASRAPSRRRDAERDGERDESRDAERDEDRHERHVTPRAAAHPPAPARAPRPDPTRSTDRRRGSSADGVTRDAPDDAPDATTTGLRAVHEAEASAESAELVHSSTLAAMAESAYARAIHATKSGVYEPAPKWRDAFLAAARLATRIAERDAREPRAVLAEWASRYVAERTSRRPDWWLERVTTWAAEGASSAPTLSPEASELARLDAAIDRAEQRGDFEELEQLRAELRSMSERHRARGAA